MKKRRLVKAQDVAQLYQATPLNFDIQDFKQFPTDVYTNYSNIAWVTPDEAQKVVDVFGRQYILEGAQSGTYYINPKYMEAEVESLLWRSRGTTPIEGDDKGTYASSLNKTIMATKFEAVCDDCLSAREFSSEAAADKFLSENHGQCKHTHKHDIEKDGRSEKAHGKYIGSSDDLKKKAQGSKKRLINAGLISFNNALKQANLLLRSRPINWEGFKYHLQEAAGNTMNGQIKSLINQITQHINDATSNKTEVNEQLMRNQFNKLMSLANPQQQRASLIHSQENNNFSQNPYQKLESDPNKRGKRTLNFWHHEMQKLSKGLDAILHVGYSADDETLANIREAKTAIDKAVSSWINKGGFEK